MMALSRDIAMPTKLSWVKRESNEGGLIPYAFSARLPGGSMVMFCYYLLGGDMWRQARYTLGFAMHF